jgi:hypothetical protein
MKHRSDISNYKHNDRMTLWSYLVKFNVSGISTNGNYADLDLLNFLINFSSWWRLQAGTLERMEVS